MAHRSKRKKKGFWSQSREALTIWGALLVAGIAAAALIIYASVQGIRAHKAHTVDMLTNEQIVRANSAQADKLMIFAHPDDEVLWGGGHMMEGGWLCVCITNGRNETRKEEFIKVIDASGNTPMILEYPDKVNGERDDWKAVDENILKDLELLVGYKKWSVIATHNPSGEYGHIHHIMTSDLVTSACIAKGVKDKLMYMGDYYKKDELPGIEGSLERLTDQQIEFKKYLLGFYKSQSSTIEKFSHMIPYEMWVPAEGWRDKRK